MSPKKIMIYRLESTINDKSRNPDHDNFKIVVWKPGLKKIIPPEKTSKYWLYWLFHYTRIFRNQDYSAVLLYDDYKLVSSLLVVPSYFKWGFMKTNDVQFTYVLTNEDYRGRGLAEVIIDYALLSFKKDKRVFWYVTDSENHASIRLCTKAGFEFAGYGKRNKYLRTLKIS